MKIRVILAMAWVLFALNVYGAEPFPKKPLRIIVPVAPGATNDFLARSLALELGAALGQTVIVENKPGGNQVIGTAELAKATPDGHTMAMLISSHVINPYVTKNLPYDSEKDFIPLAMVGIMPGLLTVHPSVPAKNFSELITYAKANPDALAYGQPGGLSSGHLTMEYLKNQAGIEILSVPYKGGGPALNDLLAGNFQVFINSPTATLPHVKSGKLRALATTGAKRPAVMADLPTIAESGYPNVVTYEWYALFLPAGTPTPIVNSLNEKIVKIMSGPAMRARLDSIGAESRDDNPTQFAKFINAESKAWGERIKTLGIKPE